MDRAHSIDTDIVLVGGGHAHVHVLTAFARHPIAGLRVTLITRDTVTPYSGMLPGVVAGLYTSDEAHIDLVRLAAATRAKFIHAEAVGVDRSTKHVLLAGRPPVSYDFLSIDVGIAPKLDEIAGAAEHAIAIKPIGLFFDKFNRLVDACRKTGGPRRIVVIGGGAGGVELLLSLRTRLLRDAQEVGFEADRFSFALVTADEILAGHNRRVQDAFRRIFAARGIELHESMPAIRVTTDLVELRNGKVISADRVLVTTDAAAPSWFRGTGLALDRLGFICVKPTLQVSNDSDVFAAGDCASLITTPLPKAGVFAVRQGPALADNLRRRVLGRRLKPWRPQRHHLALISTGEKYAVASRGGFKCEGSWLWTVKDFIDRRWIRMFQDTESMVERMSPRRSIFNSNAGPDEEMRCGGCAAKVGPGPLSRALARLAPAPKTQDILVGLAVRDDAAVIASPVGKDLVQTVDFFRAFIDDPYIFGEIAANHALNDIFAMGGVPRYALTTAVIPPGLAEQVEETLFQLLSGARFCLDREQVALIGGHSSEGADLSLGVTVTGEIARNQILTKGGLKPPHTLILTRPIGTGVLFAAAMRAKAKSGWIESALTEMRRSNREAARILIEHEASAMTDVTGYGLIGHLGEMLSASKCNATLDLATIPIYPGVLALACDGISSTLLPENLSLASLVRDDIDAISQAVLFDPQTSGGLLAGIPEDSVESCISRLRLAGHIHAAAIGHVSAFESDPHLIGIAIAGKLLGI